MIMLTIEKVNDLELKQRIKNKTIDIPRHDQKIVIHDIEPLSLIRSERLDIIAKYIYAWFIENKIKSDWGLKLYDEHIRVLNNYEEGDGSGKKGLSNYLSSFHSTLESMKEKGFNSDESLIPIGENRIPLDGAHRIAAALLYDQKVKTVTIKQDEPNYNDSFFVDRGLDALESKYCDAIAYEYCKKKPHTHLFILFPHADFEGAKKVLEKFGSIIYEKKVLVGNEGPRNLIIQLYIKNGFLYHSDNAWIEQKIKDCFIGKGRLRVYLIETEHLYKMNLELMKIHYFKRNMFYVTKGHEKTTELAQLFFNENSLHFLNNGRPYQNASLMKRFYEFKRFISDSNIRNEECYLDNSTVLAAYGITSETNIEFVPRKMDASFFNEYRLNESVLSGFKNANDHCITRDDILFNPEHHFYFYGLKFASLNVVKKIKLHRRAEKDKREVWKMRRLFFTGNVIFKWRVAIRPIIQQIKIVVRNIRKSMNSISGKLFHSK